MDLLGTGFPLSQPAATALAVVRFRPPLGSLLQWAWQAATHDHGGEGVECIVVSIREGACEHTCETDWQSACSDFVLEVVAWLPVLKLLWDYAKRRLLP
ncbi:MAG: hypothetical protein CMM01_14835 [Rhodopirellula sp.]|nr:hypothetical protein [Rhodopirellula sp.]OUX50415.1 MAG: hypothetical protein CBE43_06845 [Rhodopirellula sp. TMED283]